MSRHKLQVNEVEEQLMEATAELILALETHTIRPVANALKTIRFAQLVNAGKMRDRRLHDPILYDGEERRGAVVL